jgi:MFS family permease
VGVSSVVVAEILPVLLLAPVAGPLGDRWPRVRVMIGSDLCRVGLALVLAVWHEAPVAVYAVAFAMSMRQRVLQPRCLIGVARAGP